MRCTVSSEKMTQNAHRNNYYARTKIQKKIKAAKKIPISCHDKMIHKKVLKHKIKN